MSDLDDAYWAAAEQGQLVLQRCDDCGTYQFPPYKLCSTCLSDNVSWVQASGRGRIWSWIRMHQVYYPAFKDEIPYNVALIALEEGPMVMSRIVNAGDRTAACDDPVQVTFQQRGEATLPVFELA